MTHASFNDLPALFIGEPEHLVRLVIVTFVCVSHGSGQVVIVTGLLVSIIAFITCRVSPAPCPVFVSAVSVSASSVAVAVAVVSRLAIEAAISSDPVEAIVIGVVSSLTNIFLPAAVILFFLLILVLILTIVSSRVVFVGRISSYGRLL